MKEIGTVLALNLPLEISPHRISEIEMTHETTLL